MSMSTKIQNTDDVVLDQTSQEKIGHENIELDNETNELLSIGLQKNDSDDGKVSEDTGEDTTEEDLEVIDSVNDIKIPKRFDGESEVAYNMRVQIALATEAKRRATTEEEKSVASERLKQLRRGLGEEIKKTPTQEQTITNTQEDDSIFSSKEEEKNVKDALEKLGYVSKGDVERMVKEMIDSQNSQQTLALQEKAIENFFIARQDIASDKFKQEALVDFVFDNFNITEKSTDKQITWAFETAASQLFPKRVAQKAPQDKADLVNITGGSKSNETKSGKYSENEINEYRNMGL